MVTEGPKRNEAAEQVRLSRAWAWIKEALEPSKCDKHSAWSDPVHDHEVSVELSEGENDHAEFRTMPLNDHAFILAKKHKHKTNTNTHVRTVKQCCSTFG